MKIYSEHIRPDQVMHLQADIFKLKSALDWEPPISLDAGLLETNRWIKNNGK